jgi:drug/metabolite transporter (DMT)-like permease
VHSARIGIALFLFFLALIGLLAGISLLTGESDDLSNTGERVVGTLWLVSAALFAGAGALLLRRPMTGRALGALGAVLVFGGVLLTVNPYFGAPVTAGAALAAVLGFARS